MRVPGSARRGPGQLSTPTVSSAAITGTRTGVGRALAAHLLDRGWDVAGCSRGESTIAHPRYQHATVDVGDEAQVRGWLRGVRRTTGRIDAVVTNAAHVPTPAVVALASTADLELALRTNVVGAFLVCREAAAIMARQRAGRIVAISSMATVLLQEGTAGYAASKAALETLVRVLARELAPVGVTCNVLAPSVVETDAFDRLGGEAQRRAVEALTIRRPVTTAEIAHAIDFFLHPDAGAITGQVVHMGVIS